MKSEVLSQFPAPVLMLVALFLFLFVFIGMIILVFHQSQIPVYDRAVRLPLGDSGEDVK